MLICLPHFPLVMMLYAFEINYYYFLASRQAYVYGTVFVQDDNVDILARPQFIQVSKDALTLSAIRIYIGVESKVSSEPEES